MEFLLSVQRLVKQNLISFFFGKKCDKINKFVNEISDIKDILFGFYLSDENNQTYDKIKIAYKNLQIKYDNNLFKDKYYDGRNIKEIIINFNSYNIIIFDVSKDIWNRIYFSIYQ